MKSSVAILMSNLCNHDATLRICLFWIKLLLTALIRPIWWVRSFCMYLTIIKLLLVLQDLLLLLFMWIFNHWLTGSQFSARSLQRLLSKSCFHLCLKYYVPTILMDVCVIIHITLLSNNGPMINGQFNKWAQLKCSWVLAIHLIAFPN